MRWDHTGALRQPVNSRIPKQTTFFALRSHEIQKAMYDDKCFYHEEEHPLA
jgi:hypothetical protein